MRPAKRDEPEPGSNRLEACFNWKNVDSDFRRPTVDEVDYRLAIDCRPDASDSEIFGLLESVNKCEELRMERAGYVSKWHRLE
jgi:hypothetical protein